MIRLVTKYKLTLIGTIVGAAGGYAYYYFVGCNSGTCAITSNPFYTTIYGVLMGGLFFNMIESQIKKVKDGK